MSTLLIATDEAGYGPKLGPLVIVATAWRLPSAPASSEELTSLFAPLGTPTQLNGSSLVVADSKLIFQPAAGLDALHVIVSAALNWSGQPARDWSDVLATLAADDIGSVSASPWLNRASALAMLSEAETAPLVKIWSRTGLSLAAVRGRVITARRFNQQCCDGYNKADLLSESTIGLVRSIVDTVGSETSAIRVFCDRHGGRRYYGSVLQHVFPETMLQIIGEAKHQSRYRLTGPGPPLEISFTVKGDSFTPVALSSIIAKYVRERLMESFNSYFQHHHSSDPPLRPTAGYPVDADRFLSDIEPLLRSMKIDRQSLIRSR